MPAAVKSLSSSVILPANEEDKAVKEPLIKELAVAPNVEFQIPLVMVVPSKALLIVLPAII